MNTHDTVDAAEVGGALPRNEKIGNNVTAEMAQAGTQIEHDTSILQTLRLYWKGAFWSVFVSLSVVMRGYDTAIIGQFFALPAFQAKFGEPLPGHGNQVTTKWQIALSLGAPIGQIVGSSIVSFPLERFGRRKTFAAALTITAILNFMQFFATSIQVLTGAEFLCGIGWGFYVVISTTYASEILPTNARGFLTGYINLCYVIGQFISSGVSKGFDMSTTQWGYRIPFAIQWVWPVILLAGLPFAPESPWWLIRQHRMADAERSLRRIVNSKKVDIEKTVALMVQTDALEEDEEIGTTFKDCFKGSNRRRTEICVLIFLIQNFSGNPQGYATYFFEQVGLTTSQSFDMGLGLTAIGFVGTFMAFVPVIYMGRRRTYLMGLTYTVVTSWIIGLLSFAPNYNKRIAIAWAQATLLTLLEFFWQLTLGAFTYVIACEVSSTKLRSKTLALAVVIDAIGGIIIKVLTLYLLNPGAANARSQTEFFFGGVSIFSLIWCYFRLVETKGRTYGELDLMFERRVRTKDFAKYKFEADILHSTNQKY